MSRAVLALGGNLGDRLAFLRGARDAVDRLPGTTVLASSGVYETEPVGLADQPRFLNAAILIDTTLSARALLGACLGIEAALGRVRGVAGGPRVVDIDLLVYEGATAADPELTLPHPRMKQRGFVLAPLRDLFPQGMVLDLDCVREMRAVSYDGVNPTDCRKL